MSVSKAFKLVTHLSEAVLLEQDIFEEKDAAYTREFNCEFQTEEDYLREKCPNAAPVPENNDIPPSVIKSNILKRLYKKLAMKTHPDLSGDEEEFKRIQGAFDDLDGPSLLTAALKHDIELNIDEEDIKDMMSDIQSRRRIIEAKKNTFRWVWGESDKSEKVKKLVRAGLQIDEGHFQEWLKYRSKS